MAIDPIPLESYSYEAQIYQRSDLNTPIPLIGVILSPIHARGTRAKNNSGEGEATFSYHLPAGAQADMFKDGNVCLVWANVANQNKILITCFIIENIRDNTGGDEASFTLSGPSLLDEFRFAAEPIFEPIGVFKSFFTTLETEAPGPKTTTIAQLANASAREVRLSNMTGIEAKDEIRITLPSGTIHVTNISSIGTEAGEENLVTLSHQLPVAVSAGANVQTRRTRIKVVDPSLFYDGDIIHITRDVMAGNQFTHSYIVKAVTEEEVPTPEGQTPPDPPVYQTFLDLHAGLVTKSSAGKTVQRIDYSEPTPNDLTTVFNGMFGWSLTIQPGRTSKTSLAPKGSSPLAVLNQIADIHGEYFYIAGDVDQFLPRPIRRVYWRHTCPAPTVTLRLPRTTAERNTLLDAANTGIILDLQQESAHEIVNKIYVKGAGAGSERMTLADCSSTALAQVTAQGYIIEGYEGSALVPWSLRYPASEAVYGTRTKIVTIDIPPDSMAPESTQSAADNMLFQARNHLSQHGFIGKKYRCRAIYTKGVINPGDLLNVIYADHKSHVFVIEGQPMQVLSVTIDASADEGIVLELELVGNNNPSVAPSNTSETTAAAEIVKFERMRDAFVAEASSSNSRSINKEVFTPNLTAGHGISLIGKTISVNPVPLTGTGLNNTGNKFNVDVAALAGTGLGVSGSTLMVNTGYGIRTLSDTVQLLLAAESGLEVTQNSELRVKSPLSLSATSINAVSAGGHSHAITANDNQDTFPATLWKTTTGGEATARILNATTRLQSPLLQSTAAMNITAGGPLTQSATGAMNFQATADSLFNLNQYRLSMNGSLRFTSASPTIDTGTGTPLTIAPAAQLNLNPNGDIVYQWNTNSEFRSSDYLAQLTGWSLSYGQTGGHLDIRSLFADEFRVKAFIAELEMALAGGLIITKTRGIVAQAFTLPSGTGQMTTVRFADIPGWEGTPIFDQRQSDIVMMSFIRMADTDAVGATLYGEVITSSFTPHTDKKEQSWQIRWTYLGLGLLAANKKVYKGTPILCLGRPPNAHFIEANVNDASASPYLRTVSITAVDAQNRPTAAQTYFQAGSLANLPNVGREVGMFAGRSRIHAHSLFTDLKAEIHHASLTLYGDIANDGLSLRLHAVDIQSGITQVSNFQRVTTSTDLVISPNLERNNPAYDYEWHIDEEPTAINSRYIWNTAGKSTKATFRITTPSGIPTQIAVRAYVESVGTATRGDIVELRAQLFRANGTTPVTEEIVVARHGQLGIQTAFFDKIYTPDSWANMQLHLTWVYIPAILTPTIKLDPSVPSLAVGSPLPTGTQSGGNGLWAGHIGSGNYALRIGGAINIAPQLLYDGSTGALALRDKAGTNKIVLDTSGNSYFAGSMTIGASGGIWQGTGGTFAAPTGGFKLWNNSGIGTLSFYSSSGGNPATLDNKGLTLPSSSTFNPAGVNELTFATGGTVIGGVDSSQQLTGGTSTRYNYVKLYGTQASTGSGAEAGSVIIESSPTNAGINVSGALSAALSIPNASATAKSYSIVDELGVGIPFAGESGKEVFLSANRITVSERLVVEPTTTANAAKGLLSTNATSGRVLGFYSANINHGVTQWGPTTMFGWGQAVDANTGGLQFTGITEAATALRLIAIGTTASTTNETWSRATAWISTYKRSGTGTTALATTENAFGISNGPDAIFILKGNGDIYAGAHTHTFDIHDDALLVRALETHIGGTIFDNKWDELVQYNSDTLQELGLVGPDGMVNLSAWLRLVSGAIWQLYKRIQEK